MWKKATGCSVGHKSRTSTWGKKNSWKGHWTTNPHKATLLQCWWSWLRCLHRLHRTRELLMFNSCSSLSQHKASVSAVGLQRPGDQAVTNNQATAASALSQQRPVDTLGRASAASPDSSAVWHRKSASVFPSRDCGTGCFSFLFQSSATFQCLSFQAPQS